MRPIALLAALLVVLAGCDRKPEVMRLAGETMGTTYHVTVVDAPPDIDEAAVGAAITSTLEEVNAEMSTWDPTSEVSRLNAHASTDPVPISADLADVLRTANAIHLLSRGRFDVTLGPLIDLWGFGAADPGGVMPTEAQIAAARENVGEHDLLKLGPGPTLTKLKPEVSINLSAIAKGYGIDRVAEALRGLGITRYLVEVGGDLTAAGENPEGHLWAIGIEKPEAGRQEIAEVISISDTGMATSGDYRNFFEQDGVRYSHIIDPTTGRPITHRTASVTVLADSAMLADGLATALLAIGAGEGLDLAEENNIAAMFISHDGTGFVTRATSAFENQTRSE